MKTLLSVSFCVAICRSLALGAEYSVPTDFATIQAAIGAAADGDTIVVEPGVYYENISFAGKEIRLVSRLGPGVTILDGMGFDSVVRIDQSEGSGTELGGFTIRNGAASAIRGSFVGNGGGVRCVGSRALIEGNVFENNYSDWLGGAISSHGGVVRVLNCEIRENESGRGAGIFADRGVWIDNCILAENRGSGIALEGPGDYRVENTHVSDSVGCGVAVLFGARASIVECEILSNFVDGIAVLYSSTLMADRCRLLGNQNNGLLLLESMLTCTNTVIGGNSYNGLASYESAFELLNCSIVANARRGELGTAGIQSGGSMGVVRNSLVWFNEGEGSINSQEGEFEARYCNIEGGWPGEGNMEASPRLADLAAFDTRLRADSPCVDAGGEDEHTPPHDEEGDPRIIGAAVDIGADEMNPVIAARFGRITDDDDSLVAVVSVNGSAGDRDRVVHVSNRDPLHVDLVAPPVGPPNAHFALYAWIGEPDAATIRAQPHRLGLTVFPTPLQREVVNQPVFIWNNLGWREKLGVPSRDSRPAPSRLIERAIGPGDYWGTFTLQGFIEDAGSEANGPVSITNAVVIVVDP